MGLEKTLQYSIFVIIGALILTGVLTGLKTSALKSAYDASSAFNVTDSAGTVHTVSASPISGDTTSLIYSIMIGLVWLIAFVGILMMNLKGMKG